MVIMRSCGKRVLQPERFDGISPFSEGWIGSKPSLIAVRLMLCYTCWCPAASLSLFPQSPPPTYPTTEE